MNSIIWPKKYTPGTTDNYASNEIIRKGITAEEIWPYLSKAHRWPKYYKNASDVYFYDENISELSEGTRFKFTTFGLVVEGEVIESEVPTAIKPGRIAWHGWVDGLAEEKLDVYHGWLIENLEGGRVRILTQESQIGEPAKKMAIEKPNPMINAHQEWIEGLITITKENKK